MPRRKQESVLTLEFKNGTNPEGWTKPMLMKMFVDLVILHIDCLLQED